MKGRTSAIMVRLTASQRTSLLRLVTMAPRATIILLREEGMSISDIARTVGMNRQHVYKWLDRFQREGLAGLRSRKRGRRVHG
jgi:transposase-like protein